MRASMRMRASTAVLHAVDGCDDDDACHLSTV